MHLTGNGFLFKKRGFNLYIDYDKVKKFELIKESGSFRGANPIWDHIVAKLFEITYFNNCNQQICICFEMYVSSIFGTKNVSACKELLLFMRDNRIIFDKIFIKDNGVFDKIISFTQTVPSTDILAQIEKLAGLHQSGVLTDEEFQSKKTELLNRL